MTVEEGADFFKAVPAIRDKMETLKRVGLGYIKVGQQATTLSGGEAQRVKLSKELSRKRDRQDALHPRRADHRPALRGRRQAAGGAARAGRPGQHGGGHRAQPRRHQDRRLDLDFGPEGGDGGGEIVAAGTPGGRSCARSAATPASSSRSCWSGAPEASAKRRSDGWTNGLVTVESRFGVAETIDRLAETVKRAGLRVLPASTMPPARARSARRCGRPNC